LESNSSIKTVATQSAPIAMRIFMSLIVIAVVFWGVDRFAFEGRYGDQLCQDAKDQGTLFNYTIGQWLKS